MTGTSSRDGTESETVADHATSHAVDVADDRTVRWTMLDGSGPIESVIADVAAGDAVIVGPSVRSSGSGPGDRVPDPEIVRELREEIRNIDGSALSLPGDQVLFVPGPCDEIGDGAGDGDGGSDGDDGGNGVDPGSDGDRTHVFGPEGGDDETRVFTPADRGPE